MKEIWVTWLGGWMDAGSPHCTANVPLSKA